MRFPGRAGGLVRRGRGGPAGDGERGALTLMLAIMFVGLLALAGLVVDGGAKLNEAENATAIAQEAARAGAGMVNQGRAYSTGTFTVDSGRAVAAAQAYLSNAGYSSAVTTVTAIGAESIRVSVTVTEPTRILSIIGIDSISSTGTATASLVTGVTGPGT